MIGIDQNSWTGKRKLRRNLVNKTHNTQIFQIYANGVIAQPKRQRRQRKSKSCVSSVNTFKPQSISSNRVFSALKDYCVEGTLHGLRYVGSTSLTIGERLFWLLSFLIAVGASGWFILNVYEKWQSNPVIMSYSPYDVKLNEFPFPAITVCSLNRAKRDIVEQIEKKSDEKGKHILDRALSYLCDLGLDVMTVKQSPMAINWSDFEPYLKKVSIKCEDFLKECTWSREKVDCKVLFRPFLTDDGMCCFFNRLPSKSIFRNGYRDWLGTNDTIRGEKDDNIYDWTPQKGYLNDENADNIIPRRSNDAGIKSGLTFIMDAKLDNYYCSSTGSAGFKILVSSPSDAPKMGEYAHLLSPGVEARFFIRPIIIEAQESLRNVPIIKRRCYFEGEKLLKYYRHYSKSNCDLECETNETLAQCQCTSNYMPRLLNEKHCHREDMKCITKIRKILSRHDICQCFSACHDISYTTTLSYGKILPNSIRKQIYLPEGSTAESTTVVHFFFKKQSYNKLMKSELFEFTDIVSNIGGLLGLFMGFSIMSIVEIIYFLSLRLWCNYRKERSMEESNKIFYNKDYSDVSMKS